MIVYSVTNIKNIEFCWRLQKHQQTLLNRTCFLFDKSLGDSSSEGTPGPIPNPAVKLACADGTWGAAPWESRSLPRDFSFKQKGAARRPLLFSDTPVRPRRLLACERLRQS